MADLHNRKSHDTVVREIAIENEWRMRTACYKDNGWNLYTFVAVLLGIICDYEHHLSQTWNASQLR